MQCMKYELLPYYVRYLHKYFEMHTHNTLRGLPIPLVPGEAVGLVCSNELVIEAMLAVTQASGRMMPA